MLYSDFSIDLVLRQMAEIFNKKSTPKRICGVLLEATEIIQQLRRAAVPPPNDPLTLKELLEMDGNPVWDDNAKKWIVVDLEWYTGTLGIGHEGEFMELTHRYYRRRPEEVN